MTDFKDGEFIELPNGNLLDRWPNPSSDTYLLSRYDGIMIARVELWVHGARARDEEQWLSFFDGDAHDQSKCQLYAPNYRPISGRPAGKFYDISA